MKVSDLEKNIEKQTKLILKSKNIEVLTEAGMS